MIEFFKKHWIIFAAIGLFICGIIIALLTQNVISIIVTGLISAAGFGKKLTDYQEELNTIDTEIKVNKDKIYAVERDLEKKKKSTSIASDADLISDFTTARKKRTTRK